MIVEQAGRRLVQIDDQEMWDKLPKDVRAMPVYFRRTATGVDLWPMWSEHVEYPEIRVTP